MASLERFIVAATSPDLDPGDVVAVVSSGGRRAFTLATPAVLAVTRRPYGVVLAAYTPGQLATARVEGPLSPEISGLAPNDPGPVVVNSSGRMQVVPELEEGMFPIAFADATGWSTVTPERAFAMAEGGGGGSFAPVAFTFSIPANEEVVQPYYFYELDAAEELSLVLPDDFPTGRPFSCIVTAEGGELTLVCPAGGTLNGVAADLVVDQAFKIATVVHKGGGHYLAGGTFA